MKAKESPRDIKFKKAWLYDIKKKKKVILSNFESNKKKH